jgi:DNA-binding transcriptional regulator PaaX
LYKWLLLVYKIPTEPSARRVYIWRKLKRLGAVLLHDAVWVLPANPRTQEQFQWLAAEIIEMGGDALLWEGQLALVGQDEILVQQFVVQVENAYREILTELEGDDVDLSALSARYQQVRLEDYFQSELGQRVRAALLSAGGRVES